MIFPYCSSPEGLRGMTDHRLGNPSLSSHIRVMEVRIRRWGWEIVWGRICGLWQFGCGEQGKGKSTMVLQGFEPDSIKMPITIKSHKGGVDLWEKKSSVYEHKEFDLRQAVEVQNWSTGIGRDLESASEVIAEVMRLLLRNTEKRAVDRSLGKYILRSDRSYRGSRRYQRAKRSGILKDHSRPESPLWPWGWHKVVAK